MAEETDYINESVSPMFSNDKGKSLNDFLDGYTELLHKSFNTKYLSKDQVENALELAQSDNIALRRVPFRVRNTFNRVKQFRRRQDVRPDVTKMSFEELEEQAKTVFRRTYAVDLQELDNLDNDPDCNWTIKQTESAA